MSDISNILEVSGSNHSRAYAEIINLITMVDIHRSLCQNADCGVVLYHARNTAHRLLAYVRPSEKADAILKLTNTRWS